MQEKPLGAQMFVSIDQAEAGGRVGSTNNLHQHLPAPLKPFVQSMGRRRTTCARMTCVMALSRQASVLRSYFLMRELYGWEA